MPCPVVCLFDAGQVAKAISDHARPNRAAAAATAASGARGGFSDTSAFMLTD